MKRILKHILLLMSIMSAISGKGHIYTDQPGRSQ